MPHSPGTWHPSSTLAPEPPLGAAESSRTRSVLDALAVSPAKGPILQEFRRIPESVVWLVSERYWSNAGIEVFTSGEVPHAVTNDGSQAASAVDIFMESLRAAEAEGQLEDTCYVLELGAGSGLFAKLFLDQLAARCKDQGLDHYERTRYIVTDGSPTLLADTRETGVLADHEDRVIRLQLRSPNIIQGMLGDLEEGTKVVGSIRAIHANYFLDSLPFTILSLAGGDVWELRLRSLLRFEHEADGTEFPIEVRATLLEWMQSFEPQKLLDSLVLESRYFPVEREELEYGDRIPVAATDSEGSRQFVHSFGALRCLDEAVEMLRPDGYVMVADYGCPAWEEASEAVEFQCFGSSLACPVNFGQVTRHFESRRDCTVALPPDDPKTLQARLIGRRIPRRVRTLFERLYSAEAWERREKPYREAASFVESGRFEAARSKYKEAHLLQPYSWLVLETIAAFLTYSLEEYEAAMEVAKEALQINHLSSNLWNILGDCYYALNDTGSAEEVYRHAMRINPRDARARLNLAYVHLRREDYEAALPCIGEALALDETGTMRQEALQKQSEALEGSSLSYLRKSLRSANRMIGNHELPRTRSQT